MLPADIHGYVAEEDDVVDDFVFEATAEWDDADLEDWFNDTFLPDCIEATQKAQEALDEWQKNQ